MPYYIIILLYNIIVLFFIPNNDAFGKNSFSIGGSMGPFLMNGREVRSETGFFGEIRIDHQFSNGKFVLSNEVFVDRFFLQNHETFPMLEWYGLKTKPGFFVTEKLILFGVFGALGSKDYKESGTLSKSSIGSISHERVDNSKGYSLGFTSGAGFAYIINKDLTFSAEYRISIPRRLTNFEAQVAHIFMSNLGYKIRKNIEVSLTYFQVEFKASSKILLSNNTTGYKSSDAKLGIFMMGIDFLF